MDVEVIYPYEPLQDDELCLKVGDIISQVECLEKGWCKGVLNKVSGVFPDNFVRLVTNNKKRIPPNDTSEMKPPSVEKREFGGRRCRVVFSYVPQHEDELTLNEGDVIDIMQEVEEGWWKGLLNGKVGMFPSNFVEDCEQSDETPSNIYSTEPRNGETNGNLYNSAETSVPGKKDLKGTVTDLHSSPNSAFHPVSSAKDNKDKDDTDGAVKSCLRANGHEQSSKISKMQANVIEKDRLDCFNEMDKITINIREGKHKDVAKNAISAKSLVEQQQVPPPQLPPKPVREMARVLYPYNAEHDDELELCEGEMITILCKDLEDKGWWRGEISGKIGVFPDNFVKIISSEEPNIKPPRPEKRPSSTPNKLSPPTTPNHSPISNLLPEKKQTPPPPLPSKKVAPPPTPAEKKPLHNDADEASPAGLNSTFNHLNHTDEGSLTLTRETPLSHVTRPKGPSNRRPPSQFMRDQKSSTTLSDDDQNSDEEQVYPMGGYPGDLDNSGHQNGSLSAIDTAASTSPTTAEANHVPWLKELRENQKKKRLSEFLLPGETEMGSVQPSSTSSASTPTFKNTPSTSVNHKPSPPFSTKPQLSSTAKNMLSNPIPHMREEVKSNKSPLIAPTPAVRPHDVTSSLSTSMIQESIKKEANGEVVDGTTIAEKVDFIFKEFIPKIRSLETKLEELQAIHSRQLIVLTKDLDDERKQRACLQIEVDRLKKLFTTGYAQV